MRSLLPILCICLLFFSCKRDTAWYTASGYPKPVSDIIMTRCSVSGCHNDQSYQASGGLNLSTWNHLFEGGNGGSVAIPYRDDQSWLQFFINTNPANGTMLTPTMPNGSNPLSAADQAVLAQWINAGAPNYQGQVAFASDPVREKYYVVNQGCDVVTVFDAHTKLAMRYIDVGITGSIEGPHDILVSPDNQYWYVVFFANGTVIQKFRCSDDVLVGNITVPAGSWSTLEISADGSRGFAVDYNGSVAYLDLDHLHLLDYYSGGTQFTRPHGLAASADFKTMYVTEEYGNHIFRVAVDGQNITNIGFPIPLSANASDSLDPHQIIFSPDFSKYFVSCQLSNEVRVMDAATNTLIQAIPVGTKPQEFAVSKTHPYLFVTCMEDGSAFPKSKGSVYVINYNTLQVVKVLQDGMLYQPHGIQVDDENGWVIIPNTNANPNGPAPHHVSYCGGRNGFVRLVDLNTLGFLPDYKAEVSVNPYEVAVRLRP